MYRSNKASNLLRQYYICFFVFLIVYVLFFIPRTNLVEDNFLNQVKEMQKLKALRKSNGSPQNVYMTDKNDAVTNGKQAPDASQSFFVNTSRCKMPYVDPFTPELVAIYKPEKYESCSNEPDLVTPRFDENLKRYVLHINETFARLLLYPSTTKYSCYYEEIIRAKINDTYVNPLKKTYFRQGDVLPLHIEGIIVECHLAFNISHKLQRDAFYLVQHKVPEYKPITHAPISDEEYSDEEYSDEEYSDEEYSNEEYSDEEYSDEDYSDEDYSDDSSTPRKPSVIMFGIDSLSRINLLRTMPKVYDHLQKRGWFELQGYNKVADATFGNLFTLLSGYDVGSFSKVCQVTKLGCLDRFPFIWKDFKNASYLTAYAEDESQMSTFNNGKPGFYEPPVDFYHRPFMKAIEDNMHIYKRVRRYCVGRRVLATYIYDFCRQFMQRFVKERPLFGLFWTNHFSHECFSLPAALSGTILQYLLDFEADGVMESTIMIFLADHGIRYGDLTRLPEGFLEERLPMMFIWLPQWFRDEYPEYVKGLETNRNRLTSNYDMYLTLKHIIQLGTPNEPEIKPPVGCPKCQSVFYPVPENRTCQDAGIPDHWCTCNPYRIVTNQNYARKIPHLIANRINEYFVRKNLTKQCSKVKLAKLELVELKLNLNEEGEHIVQDVQTYRTKFTTQPNDAEFQATVLFNNRTNVVDVNVETISRLNMYHNDSLCINDKEAKKYCICYDSIKKLNLLQNKIKT